MFIYISVLPDRRHVEQLNEQLRRSEDRADDRGHFTILYYILYTIYYILYTILYYTILYSTTLSSSPAESKTCRKPVLRVTDVPPVSIEFGESGCGHWNRLTQALSTDASPVSFGDAEPG